MTTSKSKKVKKKHFQPKPQIPSMICLEIKLLFCRDMHLFLLCLMCLYKIYRKQTDSSEHFNKDSSIKLTRK